MTQYLELFKNSNPSIRFYLIKEWNTIEFVNQLISEGVTSSEIEDFFKTLCSLQIANNSPLISFGYLDLFSFARLHKLYI